MDQEFMINFYSQFMGDLESKINDCLASISDLDYLKNISEILNINQNLEVIYVFYNLLK